MVVRIMKMSPEAVTPERAKEGDAGYDLVAIDDGTVSADGYIEYRTGIAVQPLKGVHTYIFPRSSISKYDLVLANSIGLVDNGYRGEVLVRFKTALRLAKDKTTGEVYSHIPKPLKIYKKGDKIAQLVFSNTEYVCMEEALQLTETARGAGGFGSTG